MKYVSRERGKWRVRITVPGELRAIVGKRELVESGLPDEPRAREREAHKIINRFFTMIEDAEEHLAEAKRDPDRACAQAAQKHYGALLDDDDHKRAAFPRPEQIKAEEDRLLSEIDAGRVGIGQGIYSMVNALTDLELMIQAREHHRNIRERRLRTLRADLYNGDDRLVRDAVVRLAADQGLDVAPSSPEWERLVSAIIRAEIEALERTFERDSGNFGGRARDPMLTRHIDRPRLADEGQRSGTTLSEVLAAFHKERTAGGNSLAPKTIEEHKNAVRMFEEFLGHPVAVRSITKQNVIDYKRALLELPNRYTTRFPGLTLPQAIKANAKRPEPFGTLAPKTINMKYLSHLSTVLQWASNNGHIDNNPAQGVKVDTGGKAQQEKSYLHFDRDDLKKIFGHEMFADPARYELKQWATLVMLYTGVRNSSEMSGMKLKNIYEERGVPVFYLEEASKNARSKRLVPIHRDLVTLGFLDHVEALRAKGQELLFPDWSPSDKVNNWFNVTYLRRTLGITSKSKVFYSFRHTLATELARSGCDRQLSMMITGHAPQDIAATYIQDSPITLMAGALDKVAFDLPIPVLRAARAREKAEARTV